MDTTFPNQLAHRLIDMRVTLKHYEAQYFTSLARLARQEARALAMPHRLRRNSATTRAAQSHSRYNGRTPKPSAPPHTTEAPPHHGPAS